MTAPRAPGRCVPPLLAALLLVAACPGGAPPATDGAPSGDATPAEAGPGEDAPRPDDAGEPPADTADGRQSADGGPPPGRAGLFHPAVRELVLEVDYQAGAEPYTGRALAGGDAWDLVRTNLDALFAASPRTLTVPTRLEQMERLDDVAGRDFSPDDILGIAARHRDLADGDEVRTFYVLFLDGYYLRDGARDASVLGVSLGDTGVVAIFKPVVESTGGGLGDGVERFVEQTTLVHELGHAVGLVNNGLPLASPHHDAANGAHCTNRDCVMYYLNEGVSDLVDFIGRRALSGDAVVYGDECLADARAASEAP